MSTKILEPIRRRRWHDGLRLIGVWIPQDLDKEFREYCNDHQRGLSETASEAIRAYLAWNNRRQA